MNVMYETDNSGRPGNYFMAGSFREWFEMKYHQPYDDYRTYSKTEKDHYRRQYEEDMQFARNAGWEGTGVPAEADYTSEVSLAADEYTADPVYDDNVCNEDSYEEYAEHDRGFPFFRTAAAAAIIIAVFNIPFIHVHYKPIDKPSQTMEESGNKTEKPADAPADDHIASTGEPVTITDQISYSNLEPGKEYTVSGSLMDKSSGKPLKMNDGSEITATKKFTPDKPDGKVELEFTFDPSAMDGTSVVVHVYVEQDGKYVVAPGGSLEDSLSADGVKKMASDDVESYSIIRFIGLYINGGPERDISKITCFV